MVSFLPFFMGLGFLLAAYAAYVEFKFDEGQRLGISYRALCDFGIFSCTKVFSSEFGYVSQFFGLPKISNAYIGMAFYVVELAVERHNTVLLILSGLSCLGSIGLFYLLTVVMSDFCIVCFSIYVVNFTCFITAVRRRQKKIGMGKGSKKKDTAKLNA